MPRHNISASELTTLAVGGPIATVIDVASETELLTALDTNPDALCIGGGSNLLISDAGYDGVIIRSHATSGGIHFLTGARVRVEAPVDWDTFVSATVAAGLHGLESTSGVPGSFGGAVVQNLGAYGHEIASVIASVDAWDTQSRTPVTFSVEECSFSYRNSRFKHDESRRFIVTSATLQLEASGVALPRYGDVSELLTQRFSHEGPYSLQAIRDAVVDVRRTKGMLLGASLPSAGSFFTNPILAPDQAKELEARGFKIVSRSDGATLTSAAALIQAAGYQRGHRLGNAGLSEHHVLALVNAGNAKAQDIIDLARHIRDDVRTAFNVTLIPEPVTLGFDQNPFEQ